MNNEESTDIIILGGGIAGYAAAMAASEHNNVTLIDRSPVLGGGATQTNVGTICGLYYRSAAAATAIPHPFCEFFIEELLQHDRQARIVSLDHGLHVLSYEWSNLQNLLTEHLTSKNIRLLLETDILNIDASDQEVKRITVKHSGRELSLTFKSMIDCSGTGHIAQRLRHEMIRSESYQSAAQVIRLVNVKATTEFTLNMALKKAVIASSSDYSWPSSYAYLSIIPGSLCDGKVDIKLPLPHTITDDPNMDHALKREVELNIVNLLTVITRIESLTDAVAEIIFPAPGIRAQQRPRGQYILTEADVMSCGKPVDGIAAGTWPIEEWGNDGKIKLEYFHPGDAYFIPARCLMSFSFSNLFFAGKGISADSHAIGSARVTGTCLQTGYAAGKLAACATLEEQVAVILKINNSIRQQR